MADRPLKNTAEVELVCPRCGCRMMRRAARLRRETGIVCPSCGEPVAPGTERAGMADPARRPVGQARTRLEYADAATLLDDLPNHLLALQRACAAASAAVTARYFDQTMPVTWAHEGV